MTSRLWVAGAALGLATIAPAWADDASPELAPEASAPAVAWRAAHTLACANLDVELVIAPQTDAGPRVQLARSGDQAPILGAQGDAAGFERFETLSLVTAQCRADGTPGASLLLAGYDADPAPGDASDPVFALAVGPDGPAILTALD